MTGDTWHVTGDKPHVTQISENLYLLLFYKSFLLKGISAFICIHWDIQLLPYAELFLILLVQSGPSSTTITSKATKTICTFIDGPFLAWDLLQSKGWKGVRTGKIKSTFMKTCQKFGESGCKQVRERGGRGPRGSKSATFMQTARRKKIFGKSCLVRGQ